MLNTGLLIYIQINLLTADIQKIMFDKYLVGKISDHVSDGKKFSIDKEKLLKKFVENWRNLNALLIIISVTMTKNHLVFTHNDSQVTVVHFTKSKKSIFDKISKLEPRLLVVDLSIPSGRRQDKKICINRTGDLVSPCHVFLIVYSWNVNKFCPEAENFQKQGKNIYRKLSGWNCQP